MATAELLKMMDKSDSDKKKALDSLQNGRHGDPRSPTSDASSAFVERTKFEGPGRPRDVRLTGKIGKCCKTLQIFGGLVLGCIKTRFCKKICV